MESLYERLQALANEPEEKLCAQLCAVFAALGVPEAKVQRILNDLPALREKAKALSPEELEAIRGALGEERIGTILAALENDHG